MSMPCQYGMLKMLAVNHGRRQPSTVQCPSSPVVTKTCYRDETPTFGSACDDKVYCRFSPNFTYSACPLTKTQMYFDVAFKMYFDAVFISIYNY